MSEILNYLLIIAQVLFSLIVLHIILVAFLPVSEKKENKVRTNKNHTIAILIPCYGRINVLHNTISALMNQSYDKTKYRIYVIADKWDEINLNEYQNELTTVFKVDLKESSKLNSLREAWARIDKDFEGIVILDADNFCDPDFLSEINSLLAKGAEIVQGERRPKNLDTVYSRLDAFTDYFYNFLDRHRLSELGLSATISGSGFCVTKKIFEKFILSIFTYGGFDKILQNELVLQNYKIEFTSKAFILDEKSASGEVYKKQRIRWLFSYFKSLTSFTPKIFVSTLNGYTTDKLNYLFINLRPPTALLAATMGVFLIIDIIFFYPVLIVYWVTILLLLLTILLLSLKYSKADRRQYMTLLLTPIIILNQILSLFRIKSARENSLPTKH